MKQSLFVLSLVLVTMFAQAQTASDAYLKVTYEGYSNGKYCFQIIDNQTACSGTADIFIGFKNCNITAVSGGMNGGSFAAMHLGSDTTMAYFTGSFSNNATFYFAQLTICNWKGNPVTMTINTVAQSLPVHFVNAPTISNIKPTTVDISFTVADQQQIMQYNINFSLDGGKTWKTAYIVIPDNGTSGTTYTQTVGYTSKSNPNAN